MNKQEDSEAYDENEEYSTYPALSQKKTGQLEQSNENKAMSRGIENFNNTKENQ